MEISILRALWEQAFGVAKPNSQIKPVGDEDFLKSRRLRRSLDVPPFGRQEPQVPLWGKIFVTALVAALLLPWAAVVHAAAYITLDSFSGQPTTIHVSSGGWSGGESVGIYLGSTSGSPVTTVTANGVGDVGSVAVTIPISTPQGPLAVIAKGSSLTVSNSYYVVPFAPSISVSSTSNMPGGTMTIVGSGFAPGEAVNFSLAGAASSHSADSTGAVSATMAVPFASPATYVLRATGSSSGAEAVDYFYIGGFYPSVAPSIYYMMPGASLSFSGSGFAPGETVAVTDARDSSVHSSFVANGSGEFTDAGQLTVPLSATPGVHTFRLVGQTSGGSVDAMVTVGSPNGLLVPSSFYVTPGDILSFSGTGFGANESIQLFEDNSTAPLATFNANSSGAFADAGHMAVPFSFAGTSHLFTVRGQSTNATASVSITAGGFYPNISPSTWYVVPGQAFTISGSGFAPNEPVKVTLNGGSAVTVPANSTGAFTAAGPLTAPFKGSLHVVAAGQNSNVSATVDLSLGALYPLVTPSSYYVMSGSAISFSGSGFVPGETITVTNGVSTVATATADGGGNFADLKIPTAFGGDRAATYTFTGNLSGGASTVSVTLAGLHPIVSSDIYYATPGTMLHISGTGFAANETVNVTAGSVTGSGTANAMGNVTVPMAMPFGGSTSVTVTMAGASSSASGSTTVTPAPFYPQMTPSTWYTAPGSKVSFAGTGFAPNETVSSTINGSAAGTATADATGAVNFSGITLPLNATSAHFVFTGDKSAAPAAVDITLAGFTPLLSPSAWYAPAGSPISFSGSGFAPGETVSVSFNNNTAAYTVSDAGTVSTTPVTIPFSATSAHFAVTSSITNLKQNFDIAVAALSPSIWLSTYYDQGGKPLTVFGRGFAGNEKVDVSLDGSLLGTVTTDTAGNFALAAAVPYGTSGNKTIQARGESSGVNATASFTEPQVYVNLQLGSYAGAPGDAVNFIGSGYLPNETLNVTTDRTGSAAVYSFAADAAGSFNDAGYRIPASFTGGPLTLTVTGAHSFAPKSINYYVTGP